MEEWVKNAKEVIKDPKKAFTRVIEGFGTFEEAELMESAFDSLVLSNPYIMSDGY
jgi:DNA polymerase/3'-5' exonuclease PolX